MLTERINIEGMNCGHCIAMVQRSIEMVSGVSSADVAVGSVVVVYDETEADKVDIEAAITRFGYKVLD